MDPVEPRAVVADARDLDAVRDAGFDGPVLGVPDERLFEARPGPRRGAGARTTPR